MTYPTLTLGQHVAHLDQLTGDGLLVLPHPSTEVVLGEPDPLTGSGSLVWADRIAALDALRSLGWVLATDQDGGPLREGYTTDGREVVGLYCLHPVATMPDLDNQIAAWPVLVRSVSSGAS